LHVGILTGNKSETGLYYYDPLHHRLNLLWQREGGTAPDLPGADISGPLLSLVSANWDRSVPELGQAWVGMAGPVKKKHPQ